MADPIHQFEITPLVPLEVAGIDLSYTNSSLWMTIGVIVSVAFLSVAMKKKSLVPGRLQVFSEMLYEFIADMIRENLGPEGRKYFPFIFTMFVVVLMGNVLGMIPYSFTYTSHLIVTAALAVLVYVILILFGLYKHGLKFFSIFAPPGVTPFLLPLIIPIEIISFFVQPLTLSVRLFANMMAGHLVLKVFAGFSVAMLGLGVGGMIAGLLPMLFNSVLIAFEFLIALLHAYIFTILSCIYLKNTVDLHH